MGRRPGVGPVRDRELARVRPTRRPARRHTRPAQYQSDLFRAPTPTHPLVLDFSTSVVAEGKVRVAHQKGEPVPGGWILNAAGEPTTDPADLYTDPPGSILPFGGSQAYKGFGLSLFVDALSGGLSGGDCSRPDRPMPGLGNSAVFVLWDPEAFGGREHFLGTVGGLADFVRGTARGRG